MISSAIRTIALLLLFPLLGAGAFMAVEGWNFSDSIYMAIITLTTVGFQEVHPLSQNGRWVVIGVLFFGLGVFLYGVVQIGEIIVRAELRNLVGRRRMESAIKKLQNHHIVCGFGRMGESLARSLLAKGEKVVVIDKDADKLADLAPADILFLVGDITDDRVLLRAGIANAKGLAAVLSHDVDNLYVVMSARLLNKNLRILSRASDDQNEQKMLRAGANRVISPYKSGAARMAQLLANPQLEDFVEIFDTQGGEIDLAKITVTAKSDCTNKKLSDSDFMSKGIMIVGIRKDNGKLLMPPHRDTLIEINDTLIALGKSAAVAALITNQ
jgi:voltage-gated potassium channel